MASSSREGLEYAFQARGERAGHLQCTLGHVLPTVKPELIHILFHGGLEQHLKQHWKKVLLHLGFLAGVFSPPGKVFWRLGRILVDSLCQLGVILPFASCL